MVEECIAMASGEMAMPNMIETHQGLMGFASVSEQVALYIRRIERFEE